MRLRIDLYTMGGGYVAELFDGNASEDVQYVSGHRRQQPLQRHVPDSHVEQRLRAREEAPRQRVIF